MRRKMTSALLFIGACAVAIARAALAQGDRQATNTPPGDTPTDATSDDKQTGFEEFPQPTPNPYGTFTPDPVEPEPRTPRPVSGSEASQPFPPPADAIKADPTGTTDPNRPGGRRARPLSGSVKKKPILPPMDTDKTGSSGQDRSRRPQPAGRSASINAVDSEKKPTAKDLKQSQRITDALNQAIPPVRSFSETGEFGGIAGLKVTSRKGRVLLQGSVKTEQQKTAAAARAAAMVGGAQNVDNEIVVEQAPRLP